jgi:uncharacterized Zn-binding protein involved in type VI secretion
MTPAARIGDTVLVTHPNCGQSTTICLTGSPNVFINGIPSHRFGDVNAPHLLKVGLICIPHQTSLISGSFNVFVNGLPMGKVGSSYSCGATVIAGSPNVFVGG